MKWIIRIGVLATLALLLAPALALAQGRVVVDDDTGQVNSATIERAAQPLVRKGATVVVLVSDQTGGDPQQFAGGKLRGYGIQASPLAPSAIIYLVALDRRNVFIYYGADWNATLGPAYQTIADRDMIPQLARGNITAGLVAGLEGTVSAIENPPGAPVSLAPIAVAIVLVALLAIGLPLVWRAVSRRRAASQALAAAREAAGVAHQQAGVAIADFGQTLNDARAKAQYDQLSYAAADVGQLAQWQAAAEQQFAEAQALFDTTGEALAAKATPDLAAYQAAAQGYAQVGPQVQAAREQLDRAEARRSELDQLNASAPGEVDRPKKALADAAARLAALGQDFANAQELLRPLAALVAHAEALLAERRAADAIAAAGAASAAIDEFDRFLVRYADIREGISAGRAAAEKVATQGYRIEAGLAAFNTAEGVLRQAAATLERDSAAARALLDQAEAARADGVARGGGMPAQRRANDERLPAIRAAHTQTGGYIAEGRSAFRQVNEFAEPTWSDIRGNGSEAEQAAALAGQLIERADERNTMATQDFTGARDDLAAAEERLAFARTLIDTIMQRLRDLQAARAAAQAEIAAAQADIDTGWSYVRTNDPDIGQHPEADLNRAGELLAQANAEIQQERPNWLTIIKQALEANRLADQAIASARSEVDAMNTLRAQAQHAQQLAAGEVQKIMQFVALHEADLPPEGGERLAQLQAELQQAYATLQAAERHEEAARAGDLRAAVAQYTALEQHAEALYSELYAAFQRVDQLRSRLGDEVRSAEQALARAVQRYNAHAALIGGNSSAVRLINEAQAALDSIGSPRAEQQIAHAIEAAAHARSSAERADDLIEQQVAQQQRGQQRRTEDMLAGMVIGALLNSGGRGARGGGDRRGGWSSGGGSLGGWGGGSGGGWGGGGGGGGGWGGGGGGGNGW